MKSPAFVEFARCQLRVHSIHNNNDALHMVDMGYPHCTTGHTHQNTISQFANIFNSSKQLQLTRITNVTIFFSFFWSNVVVAIAKPCTAFTSIFLRLKTIPGIEKQTRCPVYLPKVGSPREFNGNRCNSTAWPEPSAPCELYISIPENFLVWIIGILDKYNNIINHVLSQQDTVYFLFSRVTISTTLLCMRTHRHPYHRCIAYAGI